jgi:hypothetical protein
MAYKLHIPHCICSPSHPLHPPPLEKPLRIQIEGPLIAVKRLLPETIWNPNILSPVFPQPGGLELAKLAHREIYGHDVRLDVTNDLVIRDEYLGWVADKMPYT